MPETTNEVSQIQSGVGAAAASSIPVAHNSNPFANLLLLPGPGRENAWTRTCHLSVLFLLYLFFLVAPGLQAKASAQINVNCNAAGALWSATAPRVNLRHIFCGELHNGAPGGYHSRQILPTNVVVAVVNVAPIANDIYNATVNFNNHTNKLSTFFPNGCTINQIVTSVVYAANNQIGPAQPWGVLGMSAPPAGGAAYCLNAGNRFRIRMGLLGNGDVNTAFPSPN